MDNSYRKRRFPNNVTPEVEQIVEEPSAAEPTVVEETPAVSVPNVKPAPKKMRTKLHEAIAKLVELNQNVRQLKTDKTLNVEQKQWIDQCSKLIKIVETCSKKDLKPKVDGQKRSVAQSGITKPEMITEEMSDFAGWPRGELHSRVEVSIAILKYIKEHSLQNPAKKTEIIPDEKLKALLKYNSETHGPMYYISIQKLLGNVIIKKMKSDTTIAE